MPPTPRRTTPNRAAVHEQHAPLGVSEPALRRQDGREVPMGSRGAATRLRLMEAARAVFEEQGYGQSSVAQISDRAGVSQGTYYQYFRDRAHVMASLVDDYVAGLLGNTEMVWRVGDGRVGLARLMLAYVGNYARNAKFARVWEEVSHVDDGLGAVRRRLTAAVEQSVEAQLRKASSGHLVPVIADPAGTARALTAMADRFCYLSYAFDPAAEPLDVQAGADLLTGLWANAIGLPAD